MLQPKRLKLLFTLLTVLTILLYNLSCNSNEQDTVPSLARSDRKLSGSDHSPFKRAPRFLLKDLEGKRVSSQKFVGKITILNFWATWCGICRIEIPHLNELYKDYKDKGVEIVGISLDNWGAKDVIPFIQRVPMHYPILIGTRSVGDKFGGIIGLPTTIIIDRKWQIYQKYPGLVDKVVLERDIKVLLAKD